MKFSKSQGLIAVGFFIFMVISGVSQAHPVSRLVCGSNGVNYQPYDPVHDLLIGKAGFGYAIAEDCQDAVAASKETREPIVCNWNGVNFQPYNVLTNLGIGYQSHGFSAAVDCNNAVRTAQRNLICTWNGAGFQMFNIYSNQSVGRVGVTTLQECVQMLHP